MDSFETKLQAAKDICSQLENTPWAITQMLILFEKHIKFIPSIKQAIDALKSTEIYKQEVGIHQNSQISSEYDEILKVIDSVGQTFERHPSTYRGKSEEELRDHILLALQPQFQGTATGETSIEI